MRSLALLALLLPALALSQVPSQVSYQGRLLNADGTPSSGTKDLTFTLFDAATAGGSVWTETHTVALSDGYYAVMLGSKTPLTSAELTGDRFLELAVAGTALSPRQVVGSVPYSLVCGEARSVTGTVAATSLSVNGRTLTDSSGKVSYAQLSGCSTAGQLLRWNGTDWTCGTETLSAVLTSGPLTGTGLTGSPITLSTSGCSNGQVLQLVNGSWACATPNAGTVTAVTATAPLASSGGATPNLTLPAAGNGTDGYLSGADWTNFNSKAPGSGSANYIQNQSAAAQANASFNIANNGTIGGALSVGTANSQSRLAVTGAAAAAGTGVVTGVANGTSLNGGTTTKFLTEVAVGDIITVANQKVVVILVNSDSTVSVSPAVYPAITSPSSYTIQKPVARVLTSGGAPGIFVNAAGSVGIGTDKPQQSLHLTGGIATANGQVKRDFLTFSTGASTPTTVHIKTNLVDKGGVMYRIAVEGYNYGAARAINSDAVGYLYSATSGITSGFTDNYAAGVTISQYISSDGFLVIRLDAGSMYYAGFSVSAWLTNPTGNAFDITATAVQQAANL